jgi:hypothetical protein
MSDYDRDLLTALHTPVVDEPLEPAYWGQIIASYEDEIEGDVEPWDPATASIDQVSGMMRRLRRLSARVADYEHLHVAEVARLNRRRDQLVGPLVRQITQLESALRQYAKRAYQDFGKTSVATPNGVLKASRALADELTIDDALCAGWLRAQRPEAIEDRPKVLKAKLRDFLDHHPDQFQRAIRDDDDIRVLPTPDHKRPLGASEVGVFVELGDDEQWHELAGVTWTPAGDEGCGRTFSIVVA